MIETSSKFEDLNIAVLLPCYNEGTSIADVVFDFRRILPGHRIFVYDNNSNDNTCLLYTSPSPRDRQKSRMPSSA